ncbi:acetylxylan esterase [Amycolatopsis sp.]|uniref:acetylxylan esterase n=1 Tax=Amycolatopsis sp. TaxID=37632 RepID=UPI002DFF49F9|nr:acetylxylan esterase [Amycolatopsis sp.]
MLTDMDRTALWEYRSAYRKPADFAEFWTSTLDTAREHELAVHLEPVETPLATLDVFDVTFSGFGGHPIRAWLKLPRHRTGPLPAVVQFHGYSAGRGTPLDELVWSSAGFAHLLMDTRGQGGNTFPGATADPVGAGPSYPGFMTRGIENKDDYYYRRVYTDAVRAVEAVRTLDFVDPARVGVAGGSQGGGIALAVAGLVPDLAAVYAQAPFMTDIRRATLIAGTRPYTEIVGYLAARRGEVEQVFDTLSYFDGVGFSGQANAPAWFSAGLMDDICPPSTAFGAFHNYGGKKQINVWDYNAHEAGGSADLAVVLPEFRTLLGLQI